MKPSQSIKPITTSTPTPVTLSSCLTGLLLLFGVSLLFIWLIWRVFLGMFGVKELNGLLSRDRYITDFLVSGLEVTIERSTTHPHLFAREPHYIVHAIISETGTVRVNCNVTDAVKVWGEVECGGFTLNFSDMPLGAYGFGNQLWW